MIFLGWINIYAAVYTEDQPGLIDFSLRHGKQLIWIMAAILIAFIILLIETKFYYYFAYVFYSIFIIILFVVIFIARDINGANAWLEIGSFRIQPGEFAKFATALAMARLMSTYNFDISDRKDLLKVMVIMFLPVVLIIMQNDLGSALVYFSLLIVLYRYGFPGWILLLGIFFVGLFVASFKISTLTLTFFVIFLASVLSAINFRRVTEVSIALGVFTLVLILSWVMIKLVDIKIELYYLVALSFVFSSIIYGYWIYSKKLGFVLLMLGFVFMSLIFLFSVEYIFNNIMGEHQQNRILVLLGEKDDPKGIEYNVNQSKIAIGSGGLTGKGFLQGTQTKYKFVPEQSTDFIFCTVGEEWGFLGTTSVILLFIALFWRLLVMAERQKTPFSMLYGYGVTGIIFFHFAINIGMTIDLAPVVGIPLPFFSYGGSSLWSFTILLFIFIKLDSSRQNIL
jgi:rod shape determining protein RodA